MNTHDKYELPPPHGYIYVWDGPYGMHRLTAGQYNGRQCDRTVAYYTEDQVRAAIEADRKRRSEPVAWLRNERDGYAGKEIFDPLVILGSAPPIKTANGETYSPVFAAPQPAEPEPCFCDRMYPDSNPDASCGDCPIRDYKKPADHSKGETVLYTSQKALDLTSRSDAVISIGVTRVPQMSWNVPLYTAPQPAEPVRGEPVAGYTMVPVEPTPQMIAAFRSGFQNELHKNDRRRTMSAEEAGLRAMLKATPQTADPVAYLDLGVGGYMDLGTALTDEQLAALPKGRHMLAIVGTYGVDGYTEADPQPAEPVSQHPDDAAVDAFAASMKAKLAKKRDEGRGGWQMCSAGYLSRLLREHVEKGDPVDVANLAMMLHQNGQRIEPVKVPSEWRDFPSD